MMQLLPGCSNLESNNMHAVLAHAHTRSVKHPHAAKHKHTTVLHRAPLCTQLISHHMCPTCPHPPMCCTRQHQHSLTPPGNLPAASWVCDTSPPATHNQPLAELTAQTPVRSTAATSYILYHPHTLIATQQHPNTAMCSSLLLSIFQHLPCDPSKLLYRLLL